MKHNPAPPLVSLPATFPSTVASLHRVAERVVSPARKPDNEIALIATPGGFGTPLFDHAGLRHQVRVDGAELVHRAGDEHRRTTLRTLEDARRIVADLLPASSTPEDEALDVDPVAARRLADWYAFGAAVLEQLVADAGDEDAPSPVRLWPEHFDIAIDLGAEQAGRRAGYGFSPGDEYHAEPYAYVAPWTAELTGELWRSRGFRGAELAYAELLASTDQRSTALDFFITRKSALTETARSEA